MNLLCGLWTIRRMLKTTRILIGKIEPCRLCASYYCMQVLLWRFLLLWLKIYKNCRKCRKDCCAKKHNQYEFFFCVVVTNIWEKTSNYSICLGKSEGSFTRKIIYLKAIKCAPMAFTEFFETLVVVKFILNIQPFYKKTMKRIASNWTLERFPMKFC